MLAVAVIWVSAIASAIIDNIPFAAAMIPVIHKLGELSVDPVTELPTLNTAPLFWALAMGCGFGGNATPIGSSANVMTVSISERGGHTITTAEWMRVGLPVMLITCVVATIFMVVFYDSLYVHPCAKIAAQVEQSSGSLAAALHSGQYARSRNFSSHAARSSGSSASIA